MSDIDVAESVLRWAVARSQKTEQYILDRFPEFPQWLTGETRPNLTQLRKFARATHTPFGYLFLAAPPVEKPPITVFRRTGDSEMPQPSPDLLDTVFTMQIRQNWMRDYLIDIGHDPLPFVSSVQVDASPVAVASAIRSALDLHASWAEKCARWEDAFSALRARMEHIGILVFTNGVVGNDTNRPLNENEFRGFALVDSHAPLVFVNNADAKSAQMFTLAHEMAHIFFGHGGACNLREMLAVDHPDERACDRAAAEFLVPRDALERAWTTVQSQADPIPSLARRFRVSELVVARSALALNLVTKSWFRRFYLDHLAPSRRRARGFGGGDFYNNHNLRLSRRFISAVIGQVGGDRLSHVQAYRMTGLYGDTFHKYAARVLKADKG